jgi:hypothetical protein
LIDACNFRILAGDVGWSKLPRRLPWALEADFISKIGIVLEEADESLDWLEILFESNTVK